MNHNIFFIFIIFIYLSACLSFRFLYQLSPQSVMIGCNYQDDDDEPGLAVSWPHAMEIDQNESLQRDGWLQQMGRINADTCGPIFVIYDHNHDHDVSMTGK